MKYLKIVLLLLSSTVFGQDFDAYFDGKLQVHEGQSIQLNLKSSQIFIPAGDLQIQISKGFFFDGPTLSFYQNKHLLGKLVVSFFDFGKEHSFFVKGDKIGQSYNLKGRFELETVDSYETKREVDCHYPCFKSINGLNPATQRFENFRGWGSCEGTQIEIIEHNVFSAFYYIDFINPVDQKILANFVTKPMGNKRAYRVASTSQCSK